MKRLNVYVDGFNLYFGMIKAGFTNCKWLDIHALAELIKNNTHTLNDVKYFTARIKGNYEKQKRQSTYLDALATTPISIIYGQYRSDLVECQKCPHTWYAPKEKMTDVNIATELMIDAYTDMFDVAIVISGDSDLVPPIKAIRRLFPQKEVLSAFPPNRPSNELKSVANHSFHLGRLKLERCQLPKTITDKYGNVLSKPFEWEI
jgi:uncharacterized LabA/DUF88 family protein